MPKFRNCPSWALLIAATAFVVGCSKAKSSNTGVSANTTGGEIPIIYPVTVAALEEIGKGAQSALEGSAWSLRAFSAEGDAAKFSSVIEAALNSNAPIMITVGTQITNTALGPKYRATRPPLIAAAISDPSLLQVLDSTARPSTGHGDVFVVSDQPVNVGPELIRLIKSLIPSVKVIGVLTNKGELNSTVSAAAISAAATAAGMRVESGFLTSSADVGPVTRALLQKGSDVILIPHDKIAVAQAATVVELGMKAQKGKKVAVFSLDDGTVETAGVLGCVSADYQAIGRVVGQRVREMVEHGSLVQDSTLFPSGVIRAINRKTAERLGLTLPANLDSSIRIVE